MTSKGESADESEARPVTPWELNFASQMYKLRSARGLNQTELARRIGLWGLPFHQQTIQRIEAGQRPIRLNEAHVIAEVLDTTVVAMTSEMGASERQLVYKVDGLRREAAACGKDLVPVVTRWESDLRKLSDLIADHLKEVGDAGATSEVVRWSYGWLRAGHEAYEALNLARLQLLYLETGKKPSLYDVGEADRLSGIVSMAVDPGGDELTFNPPESFDESTS
ncbi:helix-turn-helix transcriptional regulator [Rhodococcus sp. IEGM 1366]|uniref:helix-turn-helix transcriptional regulator n=1 Tax=Rhodococcus sp. IEGM 1366 TaxID=3082223 RepID=UPI002952CA45|nr:helix-turn-helix transcriptional regulator [Rhodococcus sp. IEGM 1366]MDV8065533.1 helix-turn-helix transcriptional regulator [Rhodococcus sp. IEGM 1366]